VYPSTKLMSSSSKRKLRDQQTVNYCELSSSDDESSKPSLNKKAKPSEPCVVCNRSCVTLSETSLLNQNLDLCSKHKALSTQGIRVSLQNQLKKYYGVAMYKCLYLSSELLFDIDYNVCVMVLTADDKILIDYFFQYYGDASFVLINDVVEKKLIKITKDGDNDVVRTVINYTHDVSEFIIPKMIQMGDAPPIPSGLLYANTPDPSSLTHLSNVALHIIDEFGNDEMKSLPDINLKIMLGLGFIRNGKSDIEKKLQSWDDIPDVFKEMTPKVFGDVKNSTGDFDEAKFYHWAAYPNNLLLLYFSCRLHRNNLKIAMASGKLGQEIPPDHPNGPMIEFHRKKNRAPSFAEDNVIKIGNSRRYGCSIFVPVMTNFRHKNGRFYPVHTLRIYAKDVVTSGNKTIPWWEFIRVDMECWRHIIKIPDDSFSNLISKLSDLKAFSGISVNLTTESSQTTYVNGVKKTVLFTSDKYGFRWVSGRDFSIFNVATYVVNVPVSIRTPYSSLLAKDNNALKDLIDCPESYFPEMDGKTILEKSLDLSGMDYFSSIDCDYVRSEVAKKIDAFKRDRLTDVLNTLRNDYKLKLSNPLERVDSLPMRGRLRYIKLSNEEKLLLNLCIGKNVFSTDGGYIDDYSLKVQMFESKFKKFPKHYFKQTGSNNCIAKTDLNMLLFACSSLPSRPSVLGHVGINGFYEPRSPYCIRFGYHDYYTNQQVDVHKIRGRYNHITIGNAVYPFGDNDNNGIKSVLCGDGYTIDGVLYRPVDHPVTNGVDDLIVGYLKRVYSATSVFRSVCINLKNRILLRDIQLDCVFEKYKNSVRVEFKLRWGYLEKHFFF